MNDLPRRLFVVWFGGDMSPARSRSLALIRHVTSLEVILVDEQSLHDWVRSDAPLHPAFPLLSAVHKADYLRCYLMHHHGGGYVDLKPLRADWATEFDLLERTPHAWAVGYREGGRHGVATFGLQRDQRWAVHRSAWWRYRWLQANYRLLMGVCGFVFRPASCMTTLWYAAVLSRLEYFSAALSRHPARHPRDHHGFVVDRGPSGYPIPWSALLADILHPLALQHRRRILLTLPPPEFTDYR